MSWKKSVLLEMYINEVPVHVIAIGYFVYSLFYLYWLVSTCLNQGINVSFCSLKFKFIHLVVDISSEVLCNYNTPFFCKNNNWLYDLHCISYSWWSSSPRSSKTQYCTSKFDIHILSNKIICITYEHSIKNLLRVCADHIIPCTSSNKFKEV